MDGGSGYAETLTKRDDAAGHLDQVINGKAAHGRIVGYSDVACQVGGTDTESLKANQSEDMTSLKTIGARIRELRRAEGIGQEELAAIIGISRSTLAGIETGGDRGGIETMIAIADHYKIPLDWLLDRKLPPGTPPVGKLIYRPDEILINDIWHKLPVQFKEAWRDALIALGTPAPAETVELPRSTRRRSTANG